MRFKGFGFILFFLIFFFTSNHLYAIQVQPLSFNFTPKPGDTVNFKILITPGEQPENAKISISNIRQLMDGSMDYAPVDPKTFPPAGWISLPATAKMTPGVDTVISGKIKIPYDAKGTNMLMAMIQSDSDQKTDNGLTMKIRYGVQINLRVKRVGIRAKAEVADLKISKDKNEFPVVLAQVKNTSPLDFATQATVTIRNSKKKLVQRVELRPRAYWDNPAGDPVIYPYSELQYTGNVTEYLPPDQYEVKLFYRYAENGQVLKTNTFQIREGDFKFPVSKIKSIKINPDELDFNGRPGGVVSKAFKIENTSDKPMLVQIEPREIEANYAYSVFKNTNLTIKSEKQFIVGARQTAVKIISVGFPPQAQIMGNYGDIRVQVYSNDEKQSLLETSRIGLSATVIGEKKRSMEVKNLTGDRNGDKYIVSAVIKNTGNIQLAPQVELLLKNKEGLVLANLKLGIEGQPNVTVLPGKMATVTGEIPSLKPGNYGATVKFTASDDEPDTDFGTSNINLVVK